MYEIKKIQGEFGTEFRVKWGNLELIQHMTYPLVGKKIFLWKRLPDVHTELNHQEPQYSHLFIALHNWKIKNDL